MTHVVLLGAGFSRALSAEMPLLPELGAQVIAALDGAGAEDLALFADNVEEYLTYIGADQPWLTDGQNLRHRARFGETVIALRDVVLAAQERAAAAGLAAWLDRVAWQWSHDRAAVLTFNYDTLLDDALRHAGGIGTLADLYMAPLTDRDSAGSGAWLSASPPSRAHCELFKLHGSVNWLHGGDLAPVTEPLVLQRPLGSSDIAPRDSRIYAGLKPFIIPPTSVKNRYYDRIGLRSQWIDAADRLRTATRLTVFGYSLPASDVGSSGFLRTNLAADAAVDVVDLNPDVPERLSGLLGRPVEAFADVDAWLTARVADRVEWWITNATPGLVEGHLEINGFDHSAELPALAVEADLDEWRRQHLPELVDVESTVSIDYLQIRRGWRTRTEA